MFNQQDEYWMQQALALAELAAQQGEVPVGAVLVQQNVKIGEGYNCPISKNDPSAHAEIMALRAGAAELNNYRLVNTTLYVTLEPCLMCAGALVHARIKRLVYGALDLKSGVIVSRTTMLQAPFLNHRIEVAGGLLANQCSVILSNFFRKRRNQHLTSKFS